MATRRLIATVVGLVGFAALLIASFLLGVHSRSDGRGTATGADVATRDFMFQAIGVKTRNQGGHTLNLFFHYRYNNGISDNDIPDYTQVRKQALDYLSSADLSANPRSPAHRHRDYPGLICRTAGLMALGAAPVWWFTRRHGGIPVFSLDEFRGRSAVLRAVGTRE